MVLLRKDSHVRVTVDRKDSALILWISISHTSTRKGISRKTAGDTTSECGELLNATQGPAHPYFGKPEH